MAVQAQLINMLPKNALVSGQQCLNSKIATLIKPKKVYEGIK